MENCETSAIGRALANWKYQGNKVSHFGRMYQYRFTDEEQWLSPRALQAKIGACGLKDVLKVYPNIQYKLIMFVPLLFSCVLSSLSGVFLVLSVFFLVISGSLLVM